MITTDKGNKIKNEYSINDINLLLHQLFDINNLSKRHKFNL